MLDHPLHYRSLVRLTQPAIEPVSVAEAKAHLRVDISDDDAYIASLISAARIWCEDYTARTFITTQWQMRLDAFPNVIVLPNPPASTLVQEVTITYVPNASGASVVLPSTEYRVDRLATPATIVPRYSQTWPTTLDDYNSVSVTWRAGYGDTAVSVPTPIRHAILMLVATWYERRQAIDSVSATEVPYGVKALLDMNRWGSYR
jgi:uncharacterized phiE125 gp8 family phage protein